MRHITISFLLGIIALLQQRDLPATYLYDPPLVIGVALVAILSLVVTVRLTLRRRLARALRACLVVLIAGGTGWQFAAELSQQRLSNRLQSDLEGADLTVTGVVTGLPQTSERGTRFNFQVERAEGDQSTTPRNLALTWYKESRRKAGVVSTIEPPALLPGQRWQLTVRLRRPHGTINPHGFDYELFALERNLGATGYVRYQVGAQKLAEFDPGVQNQIDLYRHQLAQRISQSLNDSPATDVLTALVIGEQSGIKSEQWQVFWATGVGHLISISGLHVSMFAALAYFIASWCWPRIPMAQARIARVPTQKLAVIFAVFAALGYSLIAGFSVPTQRTLYMLIAAGIASVLSRRIVTTQVLSLAALTVALIDPWALLASGFWLSFGAVAAMVYAASVTMRSGSSDVKARDGVNSNINRTVRAAVIAQAAVTLLIAPVLLLLFQEVSIISPIANAISIPIVSWLVVPLALAGSILDWPLLLRLAAMIFEWLNVLLTWLAQLPHAAWQSHAPAPWTVPVAIAGTALLFLPRAFRFKWLGLLWWLPVFAITPTKPWQGQAWVDVLDVGQGLAVVVRTQDHALVYDAGPSYSPDRDAGQRLVVPHLRGEGITSLDTLVVTHDDDDHYGGAISVLTARKPMQMLSSLPQDHRAHAHAKSSKPCVAGDEWRWNEVKFIVHWPLEEMYEEQRNGLVKDNDMGCVIEVQTASHAMLLMADLESQSELQLAQELGAAIRADVLLLPHHGSKTSSTSALLDVVKPDIAIGSMGYRNRFRHPHPTVIDRLRERGIAIYRTDHDGAVRVRLPNQLDHSVEITTARDATKRFWRDETAHDNAERRATE